MKFATQYTRCGRYVSNPGSRIKPEYVAEYDKEGVLRLKEVGYKDIYSEIQSHKESCSIKAILRRYKEGDYEALNKRQGLYLDITNMPKTMAEMLNLTLKAEREFESLPVDVRAKFGHSFTNWLATAGSSDWIANMGIKMQDEVVPNEPEKGEEMSDS